MTESAPEITEPLLSIGRSGVRVLASSVAEKLEKKKLSASMVTSLEGCAGKWVADSFVVRDLVPDEADNAGRRGSLFHKVMEDLFALPPEERTHAAVKEFVKANLSEGEFADMAAMPEAVQWLRNAINGYYNMGGDPTKVKVASILQKGKLRSGLELFVQGQIGETERPILGFIDQVIEDPTRDDGAVIVQDWKSGAKAKKWNAKTKSEDGLPEQRQQIIYSMLLEQDGVKVSGARLIFPIAKEVVDVQLGNQELRNRVVQDVEDTEKKLAVYIANNNFELKPSFLCAWCPISKLCPSATIKPYDKMMAAFAQQPDPEVLLPAIALR